MWIGVSDAGDAGGFATPCLEMLHKSVATIGSNLHEEFQRVGKVIFFKRLENAVPPAAKYGV